jgi:hypothetical protein
MSNHMWFDRCDKPCVCNQGEEEQHDRLELNALHCSLGRSQRFRSSSAPVAIGTSATACTHAPTFVHTPFSMVDCAIWDPLVARCMWQCAALHDWLAMSVRIPGLCNMSDFRSITCWRDVDPASAHATTGAVQSACRAKQRAAALHRSGH